MTAATDSPTMHISPARLAGQAVALALMDRGNLGLLVCAGRMTMGAGIFALFSDPVPDRAVQWEQWPAVTRTAIAMTRGWA